MRITLKRLVVAALVLLVWSIVPAHSAEKENEAAAGPPAMTGGLEVVYTGYDTVIIRRQNDDAHELLIVTPNKQHTIAPLWDSGPIDLESTKLDDDGIMLTTYFRTGTGTGIAYRDAMVIVFRKDKAPAVAQLWHSGYCQQDLLADDPKFHTVENKGYRLEGDKLHCDFEYTVDDDSENIPGKIFTDTIKLMPGKLVRHRCKTMVQFVYAGTLVPESRQDQ